VSETAREFTRCPRGDRQLQVTLEITGPDLMRKILVQVDNRTPFGCGLAASRRNRHRPIRSLEDDMTITTDPTCTSLPGSRFQRLIRTRKTANPLEVLPLAILL
jgi:hypothetical protein